MDLNTLEIMKTEHKHLRLLHDNAPAHKACTEAEFLESEMVNTPQDWTETKYKYLIVEKSSICHLRSKPD